MADVDSDTNFAFLVIVLAIVLMSLVAGAKINEILMYKRGQPSEAIWLFSFIVIFMILLSIAILKPYLSYEIGHLTVLMAAIKLGVMFWYFYFHPGSFFSAGQGPAMGEAITAFLLAMSGSLLFKASKTHTLAEKLEEGRKEVEKEKKEKEASEKEEAKSKKED